MFQVNAIFESHFRALILFLIRVALNLASMTVYAQKIKLSFVVKKFVSSIPEFTFEYDPPTNVGVPLNVVFGADSATIDVIHGKKFKITLLVKIIDLNLSEFRQDIFTCINLGVKNS